MPELRLIVTERQCPHCRVTKPVADFRLDRRRDQPRSWCRACESASKHKRMKVTKKNRPISNFRVVLRRARKEGIPCDLSVPDLTKMWARQKGRCALSGIEMTWRQGKLLYTSISVDRKVPALGYVRGNVRLVCFALNAFRGSGTDEEMIRIATTFLKYQRSKGKKK